MVPTASVKVTRRKTVDELPVKVTTRDYASVLMPNDVTVSYFSDGSDDPTRTPWSAIPVSVITDGMFDLMPGDSARDAWYQEGEGRLVIDLRKPVDIDSLHIFTSLDLSRGAQSFSLWGLQDKANPSFTGSPSKSDWAFIDFFKPIDLWGGGKAVYQVLMEPPNTFRYLMFVSESGGHGPVFFREVDVFEKQK